MSTSDFYLGRETIDARRRRIHRTVLIENLVLALICERDVWPPYSAEFKRWHHRLTVLRMWR